MKWRTGRRSGNVEDRRSASSRIPGGAAGGLGGIGLIILLVAAVFLGVDPGQIIEGTEVPMGSMGSPSQLTQEQQDQLANHVALILGDTEVTWGIIFEDQLGKTYSEPRLVLFTGYVNSACGQASAAVGPFYCSADQTVYIDLDFFSELEERFGAPGDFAQAYVISHEIGHHVQNLVGTLQYVNRAQNRVSEVEANQLSVALELQADCYAGVWAKNALYDDLILERGDLEEAMNAASSVGDDRIQRQTQGYIVPDSFTHGTSAQRVAAFRRGFDSGLVADCNCAELPAVG